MSKQIIGFIDPAEWSAILQYPLAQPPKGVTPDFDHPRFYGQGVIVIFAICLPLLVFVLAVRAVAKICIVKKITIDDYVYFISWLAGVAFICLCLDIILGGAYGYHAWDVRIGALTKPIIIRSQVQQAMAGPLSWLIRLSLFALIYYAFEPLRWTRPLVYGGVIASGLVYFVPTFADTILCWPRGGYSQISYIAGMASEQCADTSGAVQRSSIVTATLSVVVDFYILILPIPAIRKLQVSRRQKIRIYAVFLVAILGCMTSIVVLAFRVRLLGNQDITYAVLPVFSVNIIEVMVGLIIPCAPSLFTVWRHLRKQYQRPTSESSNLTMYEPELRRGGHFEDDGSTTRDNKKSGYMSSRDTAGSVSSREERYELRPQNARW